MEHMNCEYLKRKGGFYLQFKGPKSFGALNYSYIQMNLSLRTFFPFVFSFMNLECTLQRGRAKLVRLLAEKVLAEQRFQKISVHFFAQMGELVHGSCRFCCCCCYLCFSTHVGDDSETVPISHCHFAHCYSGQALGCQAAALCVSVFPLLHALRSAQINLIGMALQQDKKLECSAYLLADVSSSKSLKMKLNITNNSAQYHEDVDEIYSVSSMQGPQEQQA